VEPSLPINRLILGDNLAVMRALPDACVDLIYADPPFFRCRCRGDDRRGSVAPWHGRMQTYIDWLAVRLAEMRRLLRPTGTLWLHLDWRAVHYVKVAADGVFGYHRFRNEVIWAYGAAARGAKAVAHQLPRNHDVILVYAAGPRPIYHPIVAERLLSLAEARRLGYRVEAGGHVVKTAPRGDYTDASIARLEREGRVHRTRSGQVRVRYTLERRGDVVVERRLLGDVWTDLPDAMHLGHERQGYPGQKPQALLERIIACATDPDALVADFFCGSGTTAAAAQRLDRRWLACDCSPDAVALAARRLGVRWERYP
jgi:hypothetical protein